MAIYTSRKHPDGHYQLLTSEGCVIADVFDSELVPLFQLAQELFDACEELVDGYRHLESLRVQYWGQAIHSPLSDAHRQTIAKRVLQQIKPAEYKIRHIVDRLSGRQGKITLEESCE